MPSYKANTNIKDASFSNWDQKKKKIGSWTNIFLDKEEIVKCL